MDVGMAQKGQKQEGNARGEIFAMWFPLLHSTTLGKPYAKTCALLSKHEEL